MKGFVNFPIDLDKPSRNKRYKNPGELSLADLAN